MQEKYKHLKCQLCGTFNNLTTSPVQIPVVKHTDKYNRLVDPFLDYLQITVCRECFKKIVPVHAATFISEPNLWFENFVSVNDKQNISDLTNESVKAINKVCKEASAGLATAKHMPIEESSAKQEITAIDKIADNTPFIQLEDEFPAKQEIATAEEVQPIHDEIKERNKQAYKRLAEYLEFIKEEK